MKANWSFLDTIELLTTKNVCHNLYSWEFYDPKTHRDRGRVFVVRILLVLPLAIQEPGGVFYDRIPRIGRSKHQRRKYNVTTGSTHTRPFREDGSEADTFDII